MMTTAPDTEVPATPHPAKWSDPVLDAIQLACDRYRVADAAPPLAADPFAGVGLPRLAEVIPVPLIGVELEPEWAEQSGCDQGDSVRWLIDQGQGSLGLLVTSPCYGNRMADDHTPSEADTSDRITYRHRLGRPLSDGSAASMQWGKEYRAWHRLWSMHAYEALAPGALALLNMANHYRGGVEQHVVEWWLAVWMDLGATVVEVAHVPTRKSRKGANGQLRTDGERLLVMRTSR